jgi:hypothetical protein
LPHIAAKNFLVSLRPKQASHLCTKMISIGKQREIRQQLRHSPGTKSSDLVIATLYGERAQHANAPVT